ncbi:MAG: hypothetical protein GF401_19850 [Chitinivibrionales bacterium]|nr:hypothetical protein [Chitinivibrionales bacterium]
MAAVDDSATPAVENLGYPWRFHRDLVKRWGLSMCCDVGRLWLYEGERWC